MRDESLPVAVRFSSFDDPDPAPALAPADESGWDTGIPNDTLFVASATTPTTPSRRWLAFSTAAMLVAVGAGAVYAFMTPGFLTMNAPAAQTTLATRPLELVSLHYATDEPGYFTVIGIVRNPIGAPQLLNVAAVVYLFDAEGQYVGNGRIALDIKTLEPGLESSFMLRVPTSGAVSRYRVGFRFPGRRGRLAHRSPRGFDGGQSRASTSETTGFGGFVKIFSQRRSIVVAAVAIVVSAAAPAGQERPAGQGFSFKTGVDLVNVSATVIDGNGHFVGGLKREDFVVYEDGKPQEVTQFDSERVPVSLGIALDTSGSMIGEKIVAAQAALNRFLFDLLGAQDEVFLYRFDSHPDLVQPWTKDRRAVSQALGLVRPNGGTAIYDTVAEAIPLAQSGANRKKALVIISDGNDTSSRMHMPELQQRIRESEVLVYAIGIDASDGTNYTARQPSSQPSKPVSNPPTGSVPVPAPFPGAPVQRSTPKPAPAPPPPPSSSSSNSHRSNGSSVDRVNPEALRAITDDSGGRTEIIVSPKDLDPTTAGIADELSRQYFLGYVSVDSQGRPLAHH